jgi:hypothetical protein
MLLRIVGALAALAGMLGAARASDLPVTYNVQDKPLKAGAPSGTPLTFTLFTDAACTQQVYQATVPIQTVTLISKLKLATPSGAPKSLPTDQIEATLPGVTAGGNLYLTVTGTGVTASGATCQVQAALDEGALTTIPGITMRLCYAGYSSGWCSSQPPFNNNLLDIGDRQVAAALQSLDVTVLHTCDIQFLKQAGQLATDVTGSYPVVYGIQNCHALPPSCSDELKNQDETWVDCGGTHCSPCATGQFCLVNADCQSNNCLAGVCQ